MISPFQLSIKEGLIWTDMAPPQKKPVDLLNSNIAQRPMTKPFVAVGSDADKLINATEDKVTGFLAKQKL